jgi:hypothetical protein
MWFEHKRHDVLAEMQQTLSRLKAGDPKTIEQLGSDPTSTLAGMSPDKRRKTAIRVLSDSIAEIEKIVARSTKMMRLERCLELDSLEETTSDKDAQKTSCTGFLKVNSRSLDEDHEWRSVRS